MNDEYYQPLEGPVQQAERYSEIARPKVPERKKVKFKLQDERDYSKDTDTNRSDFTM